MEFDGSCNSNSSSVGLVLISPQGEIFPYYFKLQFSNTNNTAKYESVLLGMDVARKQSIKNLHAQADVELVVCQIKNIYQSRNDHLKHCRNLI